MVKALKKLRMEGTVLNIIKAIICETYSQHYTKWRTTETISAKVRNKTSMSSFPTLIQHSFRIPGQRNKTKKQKGFKYRRK
jgi:hypothetical protein